jgi:hypothetical protein
MGVTMSYMKGDEQHNNECPELGIAVKTAQTDLQGTDKMPAGYTINKILIGREII